MTRKYVKKTRKRKVKIRIEGQGRPSVMTQEIIQKLEFAFCVGATDLEACGHAQIAPATLYNYQNDNPDFLERKKILKQGLVFRSRLNMAGDINTGNVETSKWYLERKKKDEFSTKQEVETFEKKFAELRLIDDKEAVELK